MEGGREFTLFPLAYTPALLSSQLTYGNRKQQYITPKDNDTPKNQTVDYLDREVCKEPHERGTSNCPTFLLK